MTQREREEFACHLCFSDKTLRQWIREESSSRGQCPWCGRNGHLISLNKPGEPFREFVDSLYVPADGSDIFGGGELISFLLDDDWNVFSDENQSGGLAQELAVSILYADLRDKERHDHPNYSGLFRHHEYSLEESWDGRAYAVLSGDMPSAENIKQITGEIADELPSRPEVAFEDLAKTYNAQTTLLYRARIHDNRSRADRFGIEDLGAPPPESARAGRANQKGEPVLYLATSISTALAEVRPWKGAAVAIAEIKPRHNLFLVDMTKPRLVQVRSLSICCGGTWSWMDCFTGLAVACRRRSSITKTPNRKCFIDRRNS